VLKVTLLPNNFNKEGKKIVVSHTRTFDENAVDEKDAKKGAARGAAKKTTAQGGTSKAVKDINSSIEKTTLGDIDALANLKNELEKGEKK
jgi:small subunit ribosomal protein S1